MGGPMVNGGGEHAGMMLDGKKGGMADGDMMQLMMEQMMQHDQPIESMPAK